MKKQLIILATILTWNLEFKTWNCSAQNVDSASFNYTGNIQTWVVPIGVCSIQIKSWGAGGGGGGTDCASNISAYGGGGGGYVNKILNVSPGDVLSIFIGGGGNQGTNATCGAIAGGNGGWGYGNGGNGGSSNVCGGAGGGGGGASAVLQNSSLILVSAGGGGGGGTDWWTDISCTNALGYPGNGGGGDQAGTTGGNGCLGGGVGVNINTNGLNGLNTTASPENGAGGGGGGGYLGGGGGNDFGCSEGGAGGGGGSNYCAGSNCITNNGNGKIPGNGSDPVLCTGCAIGGNSGTASPGGDGFVKIYYQAITAPSTASATSILCNGGVATATATANGGTFPYSYSWSNGQTIQGVTGLIAGNYSVIITDANGCTITQTVTITQPAILSATFSITNPNCNGETGSATANAVGGTPAYTYLWSNSQTTQTATMIAGDYTVAVSDANGCTATQTIAVTQSAVLSSTVSTTNVSCNGGNNGTATVIGSGSGSYTYNWNTIPVQTSQTATGLSIGNYSVAISDGNGCVATQTITITEPAILTATVTATAILCNGGTTTATAIIAGGSPLYTYLWSNSHSTSAATGLAVGNHTVTITDGNTCATTQTIAITEPAILTATATATAILCNGEASTITVNSSGGTGSYAYLWSNTETTPAITALGSNTYTVTIADANMCTSTQAVAINEPAALSLSVTATPGLCSGSTGSSTVSVSGGTGSYTYSWNTVPVQTDAIATGLPNGSYTVTVTDANSCTSIKEVSVTSVNTLSVTTAATQTGCGIMNGTATATSSGGTVDYTYLWNTIPVQTTAVATGLGTGSYTVTVTDANGCTQTEIVNITQVSGPTVTANASALTIALGGNTQLTATGGGTYSWSPATGLNCTTCANPVAVPQQTTNYCVFVTDANNCTDNACITISVEIPCGEVFIPNAFSPNDDGSNDMHCVLGGCVESFHIVIYNRWGEKVFESSDQKNCWDGLNHYGLLKGTELNTAVFVYFIKVMLTSGEKINKKGNISLIK